MSRNLNPTISRWADSFPSAQNPFRKAKQIIGICRQLKYMMQRSSNRNRTGKNEKEIEGKMQNTIKSIVGIFDRNVRGRKPDLSAYTSRQTLRQNGSHWLQERMGIKHNASNTPDLLGFEMKNQTTSKTTFGDWSADYWHSRSTGNPDGKISRDTLMTILAARTPRKITDTRGPALPALKLSLITRSVRF